MRPGARLARLGGLAALALALLGADLGRDAYDRVQPGMSYGEVVSILGGEGRMRAQSRGVVTYEWRAGSAAAGRGTVVQVRFRDGRVVDKRRATGRVGRPGE
jgi:hypothetical protein